MYFSGLYSGPVLRFHMVTNTLGFGRRDPLSNLLFFPERNVTHSSDGVVCLIM